jgi:hypothetical protein
MVHAIFADVLAPLFWRLPSLDSREIGYSKCGADGQTNQHTKRKKWIPGETDGQITTGSSQLRIFPGD